MDLSALIKLSDLFGRIIHDALLCEQEKHVPMYGACYDSFA